jgi:hypothetical protein
MIEYTVLIPSEKEEFFVRLMSELGFEIVPPMLPERRSFDFPDDAENDAQDVIQEMQQSERDIQNGHFLPNEKIQELLGAWKKSK